MTTETLIRRRIDPWKLATLGLAIALMGGLACNTVENGDAPQPPQHLMSVGPNALFTPDFPVAVHPLDKDGRRNLIEVTYGGRRHALVETRSGFNDHVSVALFKLGDYPVPAPAAPGTESQ